MLGSIKGNIVVTFLVALVIICGISWITSLGVVQENDRRAINVMGHSASQSCASLFSLIYKTDGDIEPGTEEYEEYREVLRSLCKDSDMDYLYAYECDVENQTVTYLMCVASDDKDDERVRRDRPYGTVVELGFSDAELRALQGEKVLEPYEISNEFGHTLEWFTLVDGWDGQVLAGASYSAEARTDMVRQRTASIVIPIILALLALLAVQMVILRKHVFEPLVSITGRMHSFFSDTAENIEPLDISANSEMREIANAFEGMAGDIDSYVHHIEQMTSERVQANVELDIARRIQLGIVPERMKIEKPGFAASAFARPARAVGGDFYDCFELEDGRIAAVIGDASGKGIAAALFMAMVKTMIHDALVTGANPAELLNEINDRLCESNPESMFATVFVVVLDPDTGKARFANAGHVPPLLVGERVRELEVDHGLLLGVFEDAGLQDGSFTLAQGESLLLCTDGATEALNSDNEFFGDERFMNQLGDAHPYASPDSIIEAAVSAVDDFVQDHEQFDDLTFVALTRYPCEMQEVPVEIASFAIIADAIMSTEGAPESKRKACLACEEAFANIVSYSGAEHAWYKVVNGAGKLCVTIADDGTPFDPLSAPLRQTSFDELDGGGMGLGIIRQLSSSLEYQRDAGRNILDLTFLMPTERNATE